MKIRLKPGLNDYISDTDSSALMALSWNPIRSKTWTALAICLVCNAVSIAVVLLVPGLFSALNWKHYDWKCSLTARDDPSENIVHLDVDDAALRQYGPWPWDRQLSARIVERLTELGARVVALDVLYTSPGKTAQGDEAFFRALEKSGRAITATGVGLIAAPAAKVKMDGDNARADALYDKAWTLTVPPEMAIPGVGGLRNNYVPLIPVIHGCKYVGHVKSTPDDDGVHRRVPLLLRLEHRCLPSLSLAMLTARLGIGPDRVSVGPRSIHIEHESGSFCIPVDAHGQMMIRWGSPWEGIRRYSVKDVLSDAPDSTRASRYKDKVVIVALIGSGSTDVGTTPVAAEIPLSRVHSFALETMLSGRFLVWVAPFSYPIFVAVALSLIFSLAASVSSLRSGIALCVAVCLGMAVVPVICFIRHSYEVPAAEMLFVFLLSSFACLVFMAVAMESVAAKTASALKRYLSPYLIAQIAAQGEEVDLSTRRKELTVLFADIEGFSTISETVAIEYLNKFLNEFFELMTKAVFNHRGTVDKFMGDGLMAFFGDPLALDNHALAGVETALEMQDQMHKLSSRWAQTGVQEFEPGVRIRIGISTGIVVVGNIGSQHRMEYTVLGSETNVASRLQRQAPPGGILITSRTHALVRDAIMCSDPEVLRVKGIDRPIEVYLVHGYRDARKPAVT